MILAAPIHICRSVFSLHDRRSGRDWSTLFGSLSLTFRQRRSSCYPPWQAQGVVGVASILELRWRALYDDGGRECGIGKWCAPPVSSDHHWISHPSNVGLAASKNPNIVVHGDYPQLITFLVFNVFSSHAGLPILLAIILLAKGVQRHPTFANLCAAFIIVGL